MKILDIYKKYQMHIKIYFLNIVIFTNLVLKMCCKNLSEIQWEILKYPPPYSFHHAPSGLHLFLCAKSFQSQKLLFCKRSQNLLWLPGGDFKAISAKKKFKTCKTLNGNCRKWWRVCCWLIYAIFHENVLHFICF